LQLQSIDVLRQQVLYSHPTDVEGCVSLGTPGSDGVV